MTTHHIVRHTRNGTGIQCLVCNRTSWNENDVAHKYCGNCHAHHPIPFLSTTQLARMIHGVTSVLDRPDGSKVKSWEELSEATRDRAVAAVEHLLVLPPKTAKELHSVWMDPLTADGWTCGPFDEKAKTHPCIVPFEELTMTERLKDEVWAMMIEFYREIVKLC